MNTHTHTHTHTQARKHTSTHARTHTLNIHCHCQYLNGVSYHTFNQNYQIGECYAKKIIMKNPKKFRGFTKIYSRFFLSEFQKNVMLELGRKY
jgi:hypothetical protein